MAKKRKARAVAEEEDGGSGDDGRNARLVKRQARQRGLEVLPKWQERNADNGPQWQPATIGAGAAAASAAAAVANIGAFSTSSPHASVASHTSKSTGIRQGRTSQGPITRSMAQALSVSSSSSSSARATGTNPAISSKHDASVKRAATTGVDVQNKVEEGANNVNKAAIQPHQKHLQCAICFEDVPISSLVTLPCCSGADNNVELSSTTRFCASCIVILTRRPSSTVGSSEMITVSMRSSKERAANFGKKRCLLGKCPRCSTALLFTNLRREPFSTDGDVFQDDSYMDWSVHDIGMRNADVRFIRRARFFPVRDARDILWEIAFTTLTWPFLYKLSAESWAAHLMISIDDSTVGCNPILIKFRNTLIILLYGAFLKAVPPRFFANDGERILPTWPSVVGLFLGCVLLEISGY